MYQMIPRIDSMLGWVVLIVLAGIGYPLLRRTLELFTRPRQDEAPPVLTLATVSTISIHTSRAERDTAPSLIRRARYFYFNPLVPSGTKLVASWLHAPQKTNFNPLVPGRTRRRGEYDSRPAEAISIHSSWGGRDRKLYEGALRTALFQSTRPGRDETAKTAKGWE